MRGPDGPDADSNRRPGSQSHTTDERSRQKPSGPVDPVEARFGGREDLYEISSWEVRSPVDRLVVTLCRAYFTFRRYVLVLVGTVLLLGQLAIVALFVVEDPLLAVLSALSIVPAFVLTGAFWTSDPTRREPLFLLAATFLLSLLFASFAATLNTVLEPFFGLIPVVGVPLFFFLVVGPVEEFVKWLGIRVYAFRASEFDTVVDGVVYGAVAGLGFAAIENLIYIVLLSSTVTPVEILVERQYAISAAITRAFVGPGHVIFSAWAGFYLGLAKFNPANRGPIVLKGLLIAAFIHATYNTLVTLLPLSILSFVALLVVYHGFWFTMLYRKVARYQSYYRQTDRSVPQ